MRELHDRYGDNEVIANAFVKKALDWPFIKPDDTKTLDEFSMFLVECENAIANIDALKLLEYSENMKRLVAKLPFYLHDRWRNVVHQTKKRGETITFHDLVKFVKDESRKATDPVFGKEALVPDQRGKGLKEQKSKRGFSNKSKGSFATSVLEENTDNLQTGINSSSQTERTVPKIETKTDPKPCIYCDVTSHTIDKCFRLGALPHRERFDFLRGKGLCWGCLKAGQLKKSCRNKAMCTKCGLRHPTVLHVEVKPSTKNEKSPTETENSQKRDDPADTVPKGSSLCGHIWTEELEASCAVAIIPVRVQLKNKMHSVETYAFFDSGSSMSFCSESLLRQIGGIGKPMQITIDTMGTPFTMNTYSVTGLQVSDLGSNNIVDLPKIYTKDRLPVTQDHIPKQQDIDCWSHLRDIKLHQLDSEIGLMIGSNVPDAYAPLQVRTGPRGSPHATETLLGWVIWNVLREHRDDSKESRVSGLVNRAQMTAIKEIEELQNLDHMLRESINRDFPEKLGDDCREKSQDDHRFLEQAEKSICMVDGHYCLDLPSKNRNIRLPNNLSQGLQRLQGLKHKMLKNQQFRDDYTEFMSKILDKGYAERFPEEEVCRNDGSVWYIPHHGIYHPRKPGKIRVVFDCSASFMGVSLNNLLLPGPDLTNGLLGVLVRFRQEPVAIMGDIEAMFFQVRVSKKDVDSLRFLWWPGGDVSQEPVPYRMLVHLFGAVSSPSCSNFALLRTAEDNSSEYSSVVTDTIKRNMYVDDLLASSKSEKEASSLIEDTRSLCSKGGFKLTKWTSNSPRVLESVPQDARAKGLTEFDLEDGNIPNERALGVFWCIGSDSFGFKILIKDQPPSRRGILSVMSSLYDPIGFASPFILKAKILLQDLCKREVGWDVQISGDDKRIWDGWLTELPLLEGLTVKRCYKPDGFGVVTLCQIHTFCDASNLGYGMVSYIRLVNDRNEIHCAFLLGKSRVAPLKKISIPRMELTAAMVAVRVYKTITAELEYKIDASYFWTDSMSVIRYVNNEKTRFHTFVANRIAVIRDATSPDQWRHVESKLNPADTASRGLSACKLLQNQQWRRGPDFLWKDESKWPQSTVDYSHISENDVEVKSVVNVVTMGNPNQTPMDRLLTHFSDWTRLRKTVGWILIAIENLKNRVARTKVLTDKITRQETDSCRQRQRIETEVSKIRQGSLAQAQNLVKSAFIPLKFIECAEKVILKNAQKQYFVRELETLGRVKSNSPCKLGKASALYKLDPFVSDGLIRVGGRLERAEISFDAKHPILLPKDSTVSTLILEHIHRTIGHLGKIRYWPY